MTKAKMKLYPTLSKMGVASPKQIDRYYITSINRVDVLRIVYERPKESYLPSSRTYKFPRVPADTNPASGSATTSTLRTHPLLLQALEELKQIMNARATKENIAAEILHEIEMLEEDIGMRSECLKVLVSKIPKVDC